MDPAEQPERTDTDIAKLERQLERSQLYAHTALGESFARTGETSAFVQGLIDVLLVKGVVSENDIRQAVGNVHAEMAARGELAGPGTLIRIEEEPGSATHIVEVDCRPRLPICHAVCCKLNFGLTIREIESGTVKWDLGRPYYIRHEADGHCTHLDRRTCGCRIYADRPGVCRKYSCATDRRIWKDFEKMELNSDWLAANLPPAATERRVGTLMEQLGAHGAISDAY